MRADTAVRPYAEDLNIHAASGEAKNNNRRQAQKKRRIFLIVVSWNQSVFQQLMLLEYQIRLDLASGMVLLDVCKCGI